MEDSKEIMNGNKQSQTQADKCAREHGFFCASFRGIKNNEIIFEPRHSRSDNNPETPTFIIVNENSTEFVSGFEYYDYLDDIEIRTFIKGHNIYNALYRKFQEVDFNCDKRNCDEYDIVVSQLFRPKPCIDKYTLYDYLEIADRFHMKCVLKPNSECTDDEGNWIYHIVLEYIENESKSF